MSFPKLRLSQTKLGKSFSKFPPTLSKREKEGQKRDFLIFALSKVVLEIFVFQSVARRFENS
jgi:hypothetical protein